MSHLRPDQAAVGAALGNWVCWDLPRPPEEAKMEVKPVMWVWVWGTYLRSGCVLGVLTGP